jgi:hypothetical protein
MIPWLSTFWLTRFDQFSSCLSSRDYVYATSALFASKLLKLPVSSTDSQPLPVAQVPFGELPRLFSHQRQLDRQRDAFHVWQVLVISLELL